MTSRRNDYIFEPYKVTEVQCRGFESPRPRSGHRIACDDANIYCFGGYNPSLPLTNIQRDNPTWTPARPLFKELWSFSIASRKWKQHKVIENMPEELASNAMCMNGRYLMIFGGTGAPFGNKCSNDVIVWRTCNEDARLQILEVTGTRPPGQYGQAILCHDGCFYTVGGTNGFAYNCDIYRLDLRTLVWEPVFVGTGQEGEPLGRYRHEIARVGNKLYIIGGGTGDWAFELMEIPMFDFDNNTWRILTPKADDSSKDTIAPLPRKCHSAVQIESPTGAQVFVAGGSDGQSVFEDIWRLNISDLQWTLMQKTVLPHPLYFHSSAVTSSGCMYVFGGIEPKEDAASRNNILYKVWLCVPKLSEICWEALLHFHPNLDQVDGRSLLNIGIPSEFVQRLHMQ
ncbi:kelch domain-containing protein 10 homolog [Helicoverpa armigera]|uniref:kelch domain-containing protein 10 homolog n=1 Tax=Helicoverpa armigera TaxID=29058 RepID=UPI002112D549|nr:kelch domain-containing protein 10 homolog [Helicoverpa armigera]